MSRYPSFPGAATGGLRPRPPRPVSPEDRTPNRWAFPENRSGPQLPPGVQEMPRPGEPPWSGGVGGGGPRGGFPPSDMTTGLWGGDLEGFPWGGGPGGGFRPQPMPGYGGVGGGFGGGGFGGGFGPPVGVPLSKRHLFQQQQPQPRPGYPVHNILQDQRPLRPVGSFGFGAAPPIPGGYQGGYNPGGAPPVQGGAPGFADGPQGMFGRPGFGGGGYNPGGYSTNVPNFADGPQGLFGRPGFWGRGRR